MTQSNRVDIIFNYIILGMSMAEISRVTHINYSTIKSLVYFSQRNGWQSNRMLNFNAKQTILKMRDMRYGPKYVMRELVSRSGVSQSSKQIFKVYHCVKVERKSQKKCTLFLYLNERFKTVQRRDKKRGTTGLSSETKL